MVYDNQADLYEARCKGLDLLLEGTETVLGECAALTRERAASVRRHIHLFGREGWLLGDLRNIYRDHYRTWSAHIHANYLPYSTRRARIQIVGDG